MHHSNQMFPSGLFPPPPHTFLGLLVRLSPPLLIVTHSKELQMV